MSHLSFLFISLYLHVVVFSVQIKQTKEKHQPKNVSQFGLHKRQRFTHTLLSMYLLIVFVFIYCVCIAFIVYLLQKHWLQLLLE